MSYGTAEGLRRWKQRFARDRQSQEVPSPDEFSKKMFGAGWEEWRQRVTLQLTRWLGVIDHLKVPYDFYIRHRLAKQFMLIPPWIEYRGGRLVDCFSITAVHIGGPRALHDETTGQYAPMTSHAARLTNSSYNLQIFVDMSQVTHRAPFHKFLDTAASREDEEVGDRKSKKKKNWAPPKGWLFWPVVRQAHYTRLPLVQIPLLCMSRSDPRCNGNGPSDAFLNESMQDHGGYYLQNESTLYVPAPKGLAQNIPFVNCNNKSSEMSGRDHWSYPNEADPPSVRDEVAAEQALYHVNESSTGHVRCMHPRWVSKSTHTWNIRQAKFHKNDLCSVMPVSAGYQFWNGTCEPTVLFLAMGVKLEDIRAKLKEAAGPHWYPEAFHMLVEGMFARHPTHIRTQKDALLYVFEINRKKEEVASGGGKTAVDHTTPQRKEETAMKFLHTGLFPHVGRSGRYLKKKAFFLAQVLWMLMMKAVGYRPFDTKEEYAYQRYDHNGLLLANLNRKCLKGFVTRVDRGLRAFLCKGTPIQWGNVLDDTWTQQITTAFITGNWSPEKIPGAARKNAAMRLQRYNVFGDIAHSRRCSTSNRSQRKSGPSREVKDSQFGHIDATDTPEGPQCGVVETFTCGSTLTEASFVKVIYRILLHLLGPDILLPIEASAPYVFCIDGAPTNKTHHPEKILGCIRALRRRGEIDPHVSCNLEDFVLRLRTVSGCSVRPLLALSELPTVDLQVAAEDGPALLRSGCIDFVDALEEHALTECSSAADFCRRTTMWGERFTHMEIDKGWGTDGINSRLLPVANYNWASRKTISGSFLKQAYTNVDNPFHQQLQRLTLHYPQRTPFQSRGWTEFDLVDVSPGHITRNFTTSSPWTEEDAFEGNRDSRDAGLFMSSKHRTYITGTKRSAFVPGSAAKNVAMLTNSYDKIDWASGQVTAKLGHHIEGGDVVIVRTMQPQAGAIGGVGWGEDSAFNERMDDSVPLRMEDEGIVEATITVCNESNSVVIHKVIVRSPCANQPGDKFSSIHGNKGTISYWSRFWDLPYSVRDGCPGDKYENTLGQAARFTHGYQVESMYTTLCFTTGKRLDATSFSDTVVESTMSNVEGCIYGATGRLMPQPIAIGYAITAKLKHVADEKFHARGEGPRQQLNRQATGGRQSIGGHKTGPMERECLLSHGASSLAFERMADLADPFTDSKCVSCGLKGTYNASTVNRYCNLCMTTNTVVPVKTTHTTSLSMDELYALNIPIQTDVMPEHSMDDGQMSKEVCARLRSRSMYKLSTLPVLDDATLAKYGLQKPETLRTFLQKIPSLPRASAYTTTSSPSTWSSMTSRTAVPTTPTPPPEPPVRKRKADDSVAAELQRTLLPVLKPVKRSRK